MSRAAKVVGAIVVSAVGVVLAPFTGGTSLVWAGKIGTYLFITGVLEIAVEALTPGKPRLRRTGQDIEYSGTVEPGRIIYGQMRVSGMNVIPPWTSGNKNQNLHQVLALAAHRVQSIPTVYFGDEAINSIDPVTGTVNDGAVGSGTYSGKAWVRRYNGSGGQAVDFILNNAFPVDWDSNHRGLGIAYLAIQYELDEEVYQHGKPDVTCIVQGKRCYDPRLDTGGPGDDPAAFRVYTTNPALCLADYLIDESIGLGEDSTRIDWAAVVVAANICDEDVDIPGSTTQKRYTCNVVLEVAATEDQRRENIKVLAQAMMGAAIYRGGKWCMNAGAAGTSSFALTADDLVGEFEIRTELPPNEKYNRVRGQFVDSARDYQISEFEPRTNSSFESTDGDVLPREVAFLACDNQYEAQRNAIILLKRSRRKRQLAGAFSLSAFAIRPFDVGTITLADVGWNEQPVRCMGWSFNQDGTIELVLVEEDSTDWADPAVGDYTVPSIAGVVTPGDFTPDPVASFTVTGYADRVVINCELNANYQPGQTYNAYRHTAASPFSSATKVVSQSKSNRFEVPLDTTTQYYWWVTVTGFPRRIESEEMPQGDGVPGKASSISSGFRLQVDRASHLKTLIGTGSGTTTNTSTVTTIDAVGAPSHSWARTSGSTKISVISSSSGTTGFSASGLTDGEQVQATFTDTVTSAGASPGSAAAVVVVTFRRDDTFGA